MEKIHTVVFVLNETEIPIEKALFPDSARTLNILCNPKKYGWSKAKENNDGIVYINMKDMGIKCCVILEFIRIVRNKKARIGGYDNHFISEMEHFAILIGAGANDCPFRIAIDEYIIKLADEKKEQERNEQMHERNPMTPKDDIYNLYNWEVDSYHCLRDYLRTTEWNATVPAYVSASLQTLTCFYFRKLKD